MRLRAACLLAALSPALAFAEDAGAANTLTDLRRQFGACLGPALAPAGSQVTIAFMARRDGSLFGRPRITWSHLEGDADAKRRFLAAAEQAVDACLPLKLTPALGGAIAGRIFTITLGREKPGERI
jgi:hypothetical protein